MPNISQNPNHKRFNYGATVQFKTGSPKTSVELFDDFLEYHSYSLADKEHKAPV